MPSCSPKLSILLGVCLLPLAVGGCGEPDHSHDDDTGHGTDSHGTDGETGGHEAEGVAWYFGSDAVANTWIVTVVDPTDPELVVAELQVEDLAVLSGPEPEGNGAGPSWGDAVLSSDGSRIFANATSVNKVAVFEVATMSLEAVLDVGDRPLHLYNPNQGNEIWTHADGEGAFYVIDQTTLAVAGPIAAALGGTGHGKLLYAEPLGTTYYATNTNDPGGFVLDGAAKTDGTFIDLCGQPCEDDPATAEDESLNTCGGTHDKAYNPAMQYAIFQCSGATGGHYAFVDTTTDTVVSDLVPISGGIAHSPGYKYILVLDSTAGAQVWDTTAADHDGITFDAVFPIEGRPSDRGTEFCDKDDGSWEAWIPQTEGSKVVVVNLGHFTTTEIEIGLLTPPAGGGHFSRRSGIGGKWFFNSNDDGIVIVDLDSHEVISGPAVALPDRIVFTGQGTH